MPLLSVMFCHKGLQKYAAAEKLGNYIDPEKKDPKQIVGIRNKFLKVEFQKIKERMKSSDFCDWLHSKAKYRVIDFAAMKGQLEVVKCLLEFSATPDTNDQSRVSYFAFELAFINK